MKIYLKYFITYQKIPFSISSASQNIQVTSLSTFHIPFSITLIVTQFIYLFKFYEVPTLVIIHKEIYPHLITNQL
jgi:hypothetical protein